MNPANKWLVGSVGAALLSGAVLWEGYAPTPYKDIGGVATYCYGETANVQERTYSRKECQVLLKTRLAGYGEEVLKVINVPITEDEYSAYTLFTYNLGIGSFKSSRALRELNKGHHQEACNALSHDPKGNPAWSYINGKTFVQGLYNRRQWETKLCLGAITLK